MWGLSALHLCLAFSLQGFLNAASQRVAGLTGLLSHWGLLPLFWISESTGTHSPSYAWSWLLSVRLIGSIHSWTEYPPWAWFIAKTGRTDEKVSSLLSSNLQSNWQTNQKASSNIIIQESFLMAEYTNYRGNTGGIPNSCLGIQKSLPEELALSWDSKDEHLPSLPDKSNLVSVGLWSREQRQWAWAVSLEAHLNPLDPIWVSLLICVYLSLSGIPVSVVNVVHK